MADTFTFSAPPVIITLAQGYRLSVGGSSRNLQEVHIPFTDVTFLRDMGLQSTAVRAEGLETFSDLATATTFTFRIANMEGQGIKIEHERLTVSGGFDAECIATNRPGIKTNKTPGFHVVWTADFRIFPPPPV